MHVRSLVCSRKLFKMTLTRPSKWLVIGNESADLDSIASAFGFAYYLSHQSAEPSVQALPVLNIPRSGFGIRPEALHLLRDIPAQELTFWDTDVAGTDLENELKDGQLALALVDHNALVEKQTPFTNHVHALIDHHKDEGGFQDASPRTIEPVGSCASLVTRLFKTSDLPIPVDLAHMLIAAIVMDTVNFAPDAGRTTATDIDAAQHLATILNITSGEREALFSQLRRISGSVWNLETAALLAKDYKGLTAMDLKVGTSTVGLKWGYMQKKDKVLEDIATFMQGRELDVELILTTWDGDRERWYHEEAKKDREEGELSRPEEGPAGFQRELVILTRNAHARDKVLERLTAKGLISTDLLAFVSDGDVMLTVSELEAKTSRKIIVPALLDADQ